MYILKDEHFVSLVLKLNCEIGAQTSRFEHMTSPVLSELSLSSDCQVWVRDIARVRMH